MGDSISRPIGMCLFYVLFHFGTTTSTTSCTTIMTARVLGGSKFILLVLVLVLVLATSISWLDGKNSFSSPSVVLNY